MTLLQPGAAFPDLTLNLADGTSAAVADLLGDDFGVVLFYRGSWCPYCNAQLRAFQRALPRLTEAGIKVVALSVDSREDTEALIAKHDLTFPIGYGADAAKVSVATGAFVNDDPAYLQSTGFVLDPRGSVLVSVYSSGAIGRLVPEDVVGLVRYVREHS
ncbi:peroxiredoxin family protein [Nucisporomicrobium flavum]|uniref:peroxiredoxin family protein n=1 Tax=Nucisporomicrobium flavum TaxID=2785915 RepID=UPI003C302F60